MPNILLTTRCNLKCTYCFAEERLRGNDRQVMSLEDVATVISYLKRSDQPIFRAMGGEPTLHPQFTTIVQMALDEGLHVDVLSNATWPQSCNDFFARVSPRWLVFLLNIDHPDNYPPALWSRIERNLAAVSGRSNVTLSFNIFETQPRYEYVLDLCRRYGFDKIRLCFSLPVVGANNTYLKLADYKQMAPFIVDFVHQAEEIGVEVRLDNAVPLCIFTNEQAGELLLKSVFEFKRNARCSPIIDIGPDLTIWACFCLSKLWNRRLTEFEDVKAAEAYFKEKMGIYQGRLYPMDECYTCRYRELWDCQGGCLTHTVMRYGEPPDECSREGVPAAPQDGRCWQPGTVLALAEKVALEHYELPKESYVLFNKESGVEMELPSSFRPLLAMLDGRTTADEAVATFADAGRDARMSGIIAEFARKGLTKGANELLAGMLAQGFLVEGEVLLTEKRDRVSSEKPDLF